MDLLESLSKVMSSRDGVTLGDLGFKGWVIGEICVKGGLFG